MRPPIFSCKAEKNTAIFLILLTCALGLFCVALVNGQLPTGTVRQTMQTDASGNVLNTNLCYSNQFRVVTAPTISNHVARLSDVQGATNSLNNLVATNDAAYMASITNINGTANQITVTPNGRSSTVSLPSAITLNSLTSTGILSCVTLNATTINSSIVNATNLTLQGALNGNGQSMTNVNSITTTDFIYSDQNIRAGNTFWMYPAGMTIGNTVTNLDSAMIGFADVNNGALYRGVRVSCLSVGVSNIVADNASIDRNGKGIFSSLVASNGFNGVVTNLSTLSTNIEFWAYGVCTNVLRNP